MKLTPKLPVKLPLPHPKQARIDSLAESVVAPKPSELPQLQFDVVLTQMRLFSLKVDTASAIIARNNERLRGLQSAVNSMAAVTIILAIAVGIGLYFLSRR